MRVALFITCFNDTLFPETGKAVVRLLERLGHQVDFPLGQTCCGQPQFNTGYRPEARPLVRRFAEAFAGYDAVVTPSGSCAAMVREHHPLLAADDPGLRRAVAQVAPKVHELSEFLVDVLGVTDVAPTTRTGSPTTPPATRCACCGSASARCGCCARSRGSSWWSCRRPRSAAASAAPSR